MMRWFALAVLLALASPIAFLIAATDPRPAVERDATIAPTAVAQARLLFRSQDPRRLRGGEQRRVAVPAGLIDEAANYFASRWLHGRAAVTLAEEGAELRLSIPLPVAGRHLNLQASLREADGEPQLDSVRLGSLPVPAPLLESALAAALSGFGHENEWLLARRAIRRLAFEPAAGVVVVDYVWNPQILQRARSFAFDADELARIRDAQAALAGLFAHRAPGSRVALIDVLGPVMTAGGGDRDRQRAALLVLAVYLAEKDLAGLIPEAGRWPRPRRLTLSLAGRYDSAQHFVISAALAAWAGEPIADAIGVYKELDDARHGSGFSFADLAADRAGSRFGELIVRDSGHIAAALKAGIGESALLPAIGDLPEFLSEAEFRRRFGGPGSPAYARLVAEIETRLQGLPIYR